MKVALIHYRLINRGGLETRLFNYMTWFLSRGDDITLFVSKIAPGMEAPKGVRVIQIEVNKWPKPLRQWIFARKLKKEIANYQYDFSLSLGRTFSQDAVLAPGNHPGYLRSIGKKFKGLDDRFQIFLDRKAYQESKLIFAASEMMREEVMELFGVAPSKIKVLYPPADPNRFNFSHRENRDALRKKHGFSQDKKSFLFVSTGHFRKGLPLLLDVFTHLQNEPFELIVAGSENKNAALPNVKFIGFVLESEELYAAADFTIHPSIYEPYGQVIAESVMCGTPVILSSRVGAKEIISQGEGIVLDSFETRDWLQTLRSLDGKIFSIPKDFALQRGITLHQHMEKMIAFAGLEK